MEHKKEPIFSWDFALKNASGKPKLAVELTDLFFQLLPQHEAELNAAHEKKDWEALGKAAHKLHGALCYCGMPRLKLLAKSLEATAKRSKVSAKSIEALYHSLTTEIETLYQFKPTFDKTWGHLSK